eukprot:CAMPEP_0201688904 /NCGR_PEP_ID=MMETSP0578-20130828/2576_1 /ASSEMBLY_ACC=CAM_ASM_000663 /TAXON_ID=267565 /ORGANISM="Skeletonema grethea, Strain CCMP 1804" /LENGTH=166 /DNA_ID=CAMNT_0048173377 /DNA_START=69 /DNA_END=569 /DNA_ORIENTATION=-
MSEDAVEYWFRSKTLPWNDEIEDFLDDMGVETVEQLKFITKDQWDGLFSTEKKVVQLTAGMVYDKYLNEAVDLKKCATELHLKPAAAASLKKTPAKKAPHKDDGSSLKMDSFGFTVMKVIKTKEQKKQEKKEFNRKRKAEEQLEGGVDLSDDDEEEVKALLENYSL